MERREWTSPPPARRRILSGYGRLRHQSLELLTENEFAMVLGVAEQAVISMRKSRTGPRRVRIGRSFYYTLAAARTWIAELEHGTVAEVA